MKKNSYLSLLLCLVILLQCTVLPATATETSGSTETTQEISDAETTASTEETVSPYSTSPYGTVCIQEGCRTIEGMSPLAGTERLLATAQAVFAYEVNTGTVIYSYNPDLKLEPGSLAKVVTALLAIELCDLDEVVTCSDGIQSKVPSGGQSSKLKSGEELTVEELLHCLLLVSANDAAIALAEHISGNQQGFVVLMNDRIKQMGCTATEFTSVHGLGSVAQYTTARDMARIMMAAMENETFREIIKTTSYTVPATNKADERSFYTQNYLISEAVVSKYYDDRVIGGMQSYVESSGASLVCTAEKNNMDVVFVVLGCTRTYNPEKTWQVTSYGNFDEMVELVEYVFGGYKVSKVLYEGQALEQFSVTGGESDVVGGVTVNYDTVLPADAQMTNLIMQYDRLSTGMSAPISKGDKIATVQIWYRSTCCLMEAELFAMGDVKATGDSAEIQGSGKNDSDLGGFLNVVVTICVVILVLVAGYLAVNSWRRSMARSRRRRRRSNRRRSR